MIPILLTLVALAVAYVPVGNYMARVFTDEHDTMIERSIYRLTRVNPRGTQTWQTYAAGVLAFSLFSVLAVYGLQRLQPFLPLAFGMEPVHVDQAFNTAISFTTNTNWQSYSGEQAMSLLTQMAGLAVQNFVSAAVGISVAVALIRGLVSKTADGRLGNFWVDLTRTCLRILLPGAVIGAILLMSQGALQNFNAPTTIETLSGATQTIPGGAVASQEVIKELGTNGGGFFNANSSHPFESPNQFTNCLEIFLILVIPFSLTRTFGKMAKDTRQGWAVLGAMLVLYFASLATVIATETGTIFQLAGGAPAMEGREVRFGVVPSAFFAVSTTMTSTGAVDSFHSSYSPIGGGMLILDMLLGEISPGGVGSGLYGMLVIAIVAVFIAGLMVGRTPEYLGKRIGVREMKAVSLYILTMPVLVLSGVAVSTMLPDTPDSLGNRANHGFSEIVYAYTSASNNNGSAFAGFGADTPWFNTTLGLAMLFGRFIPIIMVLALAGMLASQRPVPATEGTLPTHRPQFVGLLVGVALIVSALTFLPTLVLGPIAEVVSEVAQ